MHARQQSRTGTTHIPKTTFIGRVYIMVYPHQKSNGLILSSSICICDDYQNSFILTLVAAFCSWKVRLQSAVDLITVLTTSTSIFNYNAVTPNFTFVVAYPMHYLLYYECYVMPDGVIGDL